MTPKTELGEFKEMLEGWQPECISLQPKEVLMRLKQAEQRGVEQEKERKRKGYREYYHRPEVKKQKAEYCRERYKIPKVRKRIREYQRKRYQRKKLEKLKND